MIRRDFIKTAGAVLASTALPGYHALSQEQIASGRKVLPLNRNWRYHPTKVAGAEALTFDDSKFERVVIPHTNVALPWHNFDDKDFTNSSPPTAAASKPPRPPQASASSSTLKAP